MGLSLVCTSEFDVADKNRVRAKVYSPYRPSLERAIREVGFREEYEKVNQYLAMDADYTEALRDAVSLLTEWVDYLAKNEAEAVSKTRAGV